MFNKTRTACSFAVLAGAVGVALFLAVVYGYPFLYRDIEASSPDNFEANVAAAMAKGDVERALRIARHAIDYAPLSPFIPPEYHKNLAQTVYARVLLEKGEDREALKQLAEVVGIGEPVSPTRVSRFTTYFAPARLTLGRYYLQQGDALRAVSQFEMARAGATLSDDYFSEFRPALFSAYWSVCLWDRALEFGAPTDSDLEALKTDSLVSLGRCCLGLQNWPLAERVGRRLLEREGGRTEAHYVLGRAALAGDRADAAEVNFREAALAGRLGAAFFLGMTLEKRGETTGALDAYKSVAPDDPYRAFGLAAALGVAQRQNAAEAQALEKQLDEAFDAVRSVGQPAKLDKSSARGPLAFRALRSAGGGGYFPLLVLWEGRSAPQDSRANLGADDWTDSHLLLAYKGLVLELQWAKNRVQWRAVDQTPQGSCTLPGWIDTAREWYQLRSDPAFEVVEDHGDHFVYINKMTWFYSVPRLVRDASHYIVAGKVRNSTGAAGLKWLCLDETEHVLFEASIEPGTDTDDWTWVSGYACSQPTWHSMLISLEREPNGGASAFDDVMLVGLREPSL